MKKYEYQNIFEEFNENIEDNLLNMFDSQEI